MNLIVIAAVIAVCGAAKLDRTYLPPASAKSAGGSGDSLKTPFSGNSFNNGLGGLPKGSYENDFQGVVVDAAAAGTRTSETGESGLGAPRISYGSTNSKVGSAAFKTGPAAFRQPEADGETSQFQAEGQVNERPRASLDRNAGILRFENEVGPENYHFAYETDNGIQAEENGVATNGVQAQGGFSYTGDDGQVYSVSYTADEGGYQPKGAHLPTPPPIPEEILKSLEQNARDEAAGLIDDGSYDAQKYNAGSDYTESDNANGKFTHQSSKFGGSDDATASGTFINQNNQPFKRPGFGQAGSNGFSNQGSSFNGQGLNGQNEQVGLQQFGDDSDSNAETKTQTGSTSGFSGQFNQAANRPAGQLNQAASRPSASNQGSSFGQASFSSSQQNNRFGSSASASAQTGSSSQNNAFGNRNEYLPPVNAPAPNARPQNGRPQNARPQNGRPQNRPQISAAIDSQKQDDKDNKDEETPLNIVPLGQQDLQSESQPQEAVTSFGQPITSGSATQTFASSGNQNKNGRRPSATQSNGFAQGQNSQFVTRPNEYLPPVNQNRSPQNRPQGAINSASQFNQQYNSNTQNAEDISAPEDKPQGSFPSPSGSQSSFGSQNQQPNGFQRPQASRPGFNGNRFASTQKQPQFGPSFSQSTSTFDSSSRPTSQPDTELTTPLEDDTSDASAAQTGTQTASFASASTKLPNGRPTQAPFGNQNNRQSGFSSRPQGSNSRPFGQTQSPAFPTQPSFGQINQNSQFGSQSQSENDDAQFAQSTQRPSFSQQQGPDDSYYYNQPARPFGTPQGSRFPSAPSNQFASMNQQSFSQNGQFNSQDVPSTTFPSTQPQAIRQPQPPTLGTIVSSAQAQSQFGSQSQGSRFPTNQFVSMNQQSFSQNTQFSNSQNIPTTAFPSAQATRQPQPPTLGTIVASSDAQQFGAQSQGFTKYPRPQAFAPSRPTPSSQNQFQGSTNGITQASISPFPSQTPTQASQFNTQGSFGSRPNYQQSSQFSQSSQASMSSFGQPSTPAPFGQRHQKPANTFQGQSQTETQDQKEDVGKPVDVPQYTGEIYEYSKPAVTLPPPDSTPASSAGEEQSQDARPQFGQTSDEEDQRPSSQPQGVRPQFGGQSRPQFGQSQSQSSFGGRPMSSTEDSKPYGALAQNFAQQSVSRPQPGSQTRPQFGQGFTAQKPEDKMPQFGAQADTNEESDADKRPVNQFGFISPCCKETPEFGRKPQSQGFGGQNQFAQSFAGAQGFKPESTSSFAGKGEEFGGPRQPPSFDEQTGYHY